VATQPVYCTREQVKRALDSAETARNNTRIDDAIQSGSRAADTLCRRRFYPELATRSFPWPNPQQSAYSWRLWMDENDLISVDSITSGGVTLTAYLLEPVNSGPPYTSVEIDLSSSAAFTAGSTWQRSIAITGWHGYRDDTAVAGALAEGLDASEPAVDVTDSAAIGIGSLIKVDSERMIVTGKRLLDTAQNLQTSLTAQNNATSVAVTDGTLFAVDEEIVIDAETMLVVKIAGNTLIVKRAWDGSVLAAHTAPTADIYAPRTLVVERGAVGTTAATHSTAAAVTVWKPPALVGRLARAEALVELGVESAGYAGSPGAGQAKRPPQGGTLEDLRCQVRDAHGRKARIGVV
jgi:hypothetical protein